MKRGDAVHLRYASEAKQNMCIYMAASPVDVTRRIVTCRSNASVPDVHMRLGRCACANIDELSIAGSPPEEHLA